MQERFLWASSKPVFPAFWVIWTKCLAEGESPEVSDKQSFCLGLLPLEKPPMDTAHGWSYLFSGFSGKTNNFLQVKNHSQWK